MTLDFETIVAAHRAAPNHDPVQKFTYAFTLWTIWDHTLDDIGSWNLGMWVNQCDAFT